MRERGQAAGVGVDRDFAVAARGGAVRRGFGSGVAKVSVLGIS